MKYSISEASRIVGVTRKTLYKHIEKKPISVEKDPNGRPIIDASELIRIYGDACNFDQEGDVKETKKTPQVSTEVNIEKITEMAVTQKELELLKIQIKSEKENYEEQIEYLRKKLDESNSETRKLTALITDQTSKDKNRGGEWEQEINALKTQVANQENQLKNELAETKKKAQTQITRYKQELEEEKSKGLFAKLFG